MAAVSRAGPVQNAVSGVFRGISREGAVPAQHIRITRVPVTTTAADVRRAILRQDLQGITDVVLEYEHFMPRGSALITLSKPDFLKDNLRLIQNMSIAGIPVKSEAVKPEEVPTPSRLRGLKGRVQSAARGLLTGDGPRAGVSDNGRCVTIWGLPGRLAVEAVETYLVDLGFELPRAKDGTSDLVRVELPEGKFSMFSRYFVTMPSVSEAQRLVRMVHNTPWPNHSLPCTLYARIIT
ncbi:hypothetical protein BDQ12DRAFT_719798 [Crucibulum laeve]|uniref:RRM domain-containing protein n=1 Tax=Crucibulum laeve TaxID=68775 RepID=A0A5C3MCB8_9AGAR|nr:hypothetical protein BDQ12DRAFT_719798 [Crucibulum laeve]